ncbi:hypothetical protein E2C01_091000 [Portunus trituberculatus]|uniref:Uncharacterized protein n=1 Tax=Portunus trituberculatus TaxID=210409 RepID=A0A5B7JTW8_PORTR|nr:hypothetical protein [Portunus trituberculatus]
MSVRSVKDPFQFPQRLVEEEHGRGDVSSDSSERSGGEGMGNGGEGGAGYRGSRMISSKPDNEA